MSRGKGPPAPAWAGPLKQVLPLAQAGWWLRSAQLSWGQSHHCCGGGISKGMGRVPALWTLLDGVVSRLR